MSNEPENTKQIFAGHARPQRDRFLPLFSPWTTHQELRYVRQVLATGSARSCIEELESGMTEYTNSRYAIAFASIGSALTAALNALDIGAGDEVVAPAIGLESTIQAIQRTGARPVVCDVGDSLTLSAESAARCLSLQTRAVVVSHWGGQVADIAELADLCRRCSIHLIEDATHALGAAHQTKFLGTFGAFGIYSFHPTNDFLSGEGAVLVTDVRCLMERIRKQPAVKEFRMTGLQAALALGQLEKQEFFLELRSRYAATYLEHLDDLPLQLPQVAPDCRAAWHLFTVSADWSEFELTREELLARLHSENIGSGVAAVPLHMVGKRCRDEECRRQVARQPAETGNRSDPLFRQKPTTAERLGARMVSLPLYARMTPADVNDVIVALRNILGHECESSGKPRFLNTDQSSLTQAAVKRQHRRAATPPGTT